jgi:hypothetical protein
VNLFIGGNQTMSQNNNDNTVNISGGNVTGNQFAAGSKDFQGTINNISQNDLKKIDELTESLIASISNEQEIQGADPQEIIDAVKQVRSEASKKTVNKISIKGLLSGINMVVTNLKNISASSKAIYNDWYAHFTNLFY